MGRALVSLPGEAASSFSNPAATASIDRSEFSAFHTSLFLGTNYDCVALAHPIGMLGVFTVSAGRLGTGSFAGRDEFNRIDKTITASESQLGLSYARPILAGVTGGLTLKGVGQDIADNAGYGFGLDLGIQYKPEYFSGVIIGAAVNDLIQPSVKLLTLRDKYQRVSRIGISYSRPISRIIAASGVIEIEKVSSRSTEFRPGIEAAFYKNYFLRAGHDGKRPTFGAGLVYNFIRLDYAYENIQDLGGSHRISMTFSFGKSVRNARQEMVAEALKTEKINWQKSLDQKRSSDFAMLMSRADSLQTMGHFQEAIGYYQRALGVDETSSRAKTMSDSLMSLIIANAASAVRDQKREELISRRIEQALMRFKAGRYNEAISEYELALEIDPSNKTVKDLLQSAQDTRISEIGDIRKNAQSLKSRGDYSSALLEWNKLLILEPTDAEAKLNIDISRNQLKADALVSAAVTSAGEGKYSSAVTYLEQAQAIKPNDVTIKTLLADARAKASPPTSLTDIKASAEHWSIYLKGLESYQASDYQSALKSWESLRQFYPNNLDLEKNIGQARQRLTTEGGKTQE